MVNDNSKMFVVTHKSIDNKIKNDGYKYIGVNRNAKDLECYDDTFDNINSKNPTYCELTTLYWIWKNVKCNNVGLSHYRRFFVKETSNNEWNVCDLDYLDSLLDSYDIILPKKINFGINVLKQYEITHRNDALYKICKRIESKDNTYSDVIKKFFKTKEMYCYNMFYCKKELIDKYCAWLFDALFEFEKDVNMDGWHDYDKRLYGFLSERLFNLWIMHENLNVVEVDVAMSDTFPADGGCVNQYSVKKDLIYYRNSLIRGINRHLWVRNSTKKK